jgi:hypothetical protein
MRAQPVAPLLNPFTWVPIAMRFAELLMASGQVIAIRTTRAAMADPRHSRRDRRELTLMGREKVEAATESIARMSAQWLGLSLQYAMFGWKQWVALARMASPLSGANAMRSVVRNNARLTAATLRSTARATQQGLKPIHKRATRNARRLRK